MRLAQSAERAAARRRTRRARPICSSSAAAVAPAGAADGGERALQRVRGQAQRLAVAAGQRALDAPQRTRDSPARNSATISLSSRRSPPVCASAACSSKTGAVAGRARPATRQPACARACRPKRSTVAIELVDVDRLRQVAVHAGREAALAIALHARAPSARRSARAAVPASRCADRLRSLRGRPSPASARPSARRRTALRRRRSPSTASRPFSTACDRVAALPQQRRDELPVRRRCLRRRECAASASARRVASAVLAGADVRRSTRRTSRDERVEQVGVLDRLGEVGVDARAGGTARRRRIARPTSA